MLRRVVVRPELQAAISHRRRQMAALWQRRQKVRWLQRKQAARAQARVLRARRSSIKQRLRWQQERMSLRRQRREMEQPELLGQLVPGLPAGCLHEPASAWVRQELARRASLLLGC
jgi:hypothetical protein